MSCCSQTASDNIMLMSFITFKQPGLALLSRKAIHLMKALKAEPLWYMMASVSVLQVEVPVGMAYSLP